MLSTLVRIADVRDTKAFAEVPEVLEGKYCRVAFKGLGMGDGVAVDTAQESHCNGLAAFGGMRKDQAILHRSLFPVCSSGYSEGVTLDDHVGCQLGPKSGMPSWEASDSFRDKEAFG